MPQPPIKRYVLVPRDQRGGVQRFRLARLERMEEVAARDAGRSGGLEPGAGGFVGQLGGRATRDDYDRDGRVSDDLRRA